MKITWSIPVRGERLDSTRGDLVRARRLVEALRSQGHEVHVVEDAARRASALVVSTYRRVVKRVLPSVMARVLRDLGRWLHARAHGRRVAKAACKQGADVIVETHVNVAGSGALAARLAGLPLVLDDCSPVDEEGAFGVGLPGLASAVFRQQTAAASVIVVPSRVLRDRLVEGGVAPHKLRVIPNGVDLSACQGVDHRAARARFGFTDQCVIGFVGSFQPWHRLDLLVEVLAGLIVDHPVHLLLVGTGPTREAVLAGVHRRGLEHCTTVVGAVPPREIPQVLACFDVGVLPGSNDYGHPMKLMEYAAAGIPSVAPDLAPVREVLEDGVTGLLFPEGDEPALRRALARLAEDKQVRTELGSRACSRIAKQAAWADRARMLASYASMEPAEPDALRSVPAGVKGVRQ